jgi:hypothetical protein
MPHEVDVTHTLRVEVVPGLRMHLGYVIPGPGLFTRFIYRQISSVRSNLIQILLEYRSVFLRHFLPIIC